MRQLLFLSPHFIFEYEINSRGYAIIHNTVYRYNKSIKRSLLEAAEIVKDILRSKGVKVVVSSVPLGITYKYNLMFGLLDSGQKNSKTNNPLLYLLL